MGSSFSVSPGEVYGLLGGNGAGKSTTLLTFLGFLQPTSGECRVKGLPVRDSIRASRQAIAYLPEAAALYEHLSARENLDYFLELAGLSVTSAARETALDRVSLNEMARDERLGGTRRVCGKRLPSRLPYFVTLRFCCWMNRPQGWIQ